MPAVDLAGLLCSRLCHDLVGPVGSLLNGLELIGEEADPDLRDHCLEMVAVSARTTADKLKFFRLAFGGGPTSEPIDSREAEAALGGYMGGDRGIQVLWKLGAHSLPQQDAKLILALAMIAGETLLRGGTLTILEQEGGVLIRAEGDRLVFEPELRAAIEGSAGHDASSPRMAVALMVDALLAITGRRLAIAEPAEQTLLLTISAPQHAA